MTKATLRRAALASVPFLLLATSSSAAWAHGATMPPFLIGEWKMGKPIMFTAANYGYPRDEMEDLHRVQGTMYVTATSIAFAPGFVPHPNGRKVDVVTGQRSLDTFAKLDPNEAAGTPLADVHAVVATVTVTPADCPISAIPSYDSSGRHECAWQTFLSPDGFSSTIFLWEPAAVLPLTRVVNPPSPSKRRGRPRRG